MKKAQSPGKGILKMIGMKFFFPCFFMVLGFNAGAQHIIPAKDSLIATFTIQNKKAADILPDGKALSVSAQNAASDLVFILDRFFSTDKYRKSKKIPVKQYVNNSHVVQDDVVVDSVESVVYILEIPNAGTYNGRLKGNAFLPVKDFNPSKIPGQLFIRSVNNHLLMLVSVKSFLYKEADAFEQRQNNIRAHLDSVLQKYR